MTPDQLHVFLHYLKTTYPEAFLDAMKHVEGYKTFMEGESIKWLRLEKEHLVQAPEVYKDFIDRLIEKL